MDALAPTTRSAAAPLPPKEAEEKTATRISSDFETFLKMLTTQLQNQNPLDPVKSEDFAVQLATFSGVEQQVRTNDLLEAMAQQQTLSGLTGLAGWIGMEAKAEVPVRFDGRPVTIDTDLPAGTDQATLIVRDATGREVGRTALPISSEPFVWTGTDQFGAPLPPGTYDLFVEARGSGNPLATTVPAHYAQITEARIEDGAPVLVFASGATKPAAEVAAVRLPTP